MGNSTSKSGFAAKVTSLPARSKTSIYALLLSQLSSFHPKTIIDFRQKKELMTIVKKAILDHEQSLSVVGFHLKQAATTRGISSHFKALVKDASDALANSNFKKSFEVQTVTPQDLPARIPRQVESQIAVHLLESPTLLMWKSVNKISAAIVDLLAKHVDKPDLFTEFLLHINGKPGNELEPTIPLAFAHFYTETTLTDVVQILKEGNDLAAVMLIQFMFMRDAFALLDVDAGFFQNILSNKFGGEFKLHLQDSDLDDSQNHNLITMFFLQYTLFSPQLYTDRGRAEFNSHLDNHLGISTHANDRIAMGKQLTSWYPDCMCQTADLQSPFLTNVVQHDIPYVSGASGMTSLFLGAMTLLGNFPTPQEKQYYLLAVVAFMVSGGLHSMHEVLSVPKVRLGLLPEYQTEGNKMGNYDTAFFSLFANDPEVASRLNSAWTQTIEWINCTYPKAFPNDVALEKTTEENPQISPLNK